MNKQKLLSITMTLLLGVSSIFAQKQPVDYVNPLMGTDSKISLSNGNTYPAIALPWGMNFWMPQTGKMGDVGLTRMLLTKSEVSSRPTSPVPGSMTTDSSPLCRWPNSWRLIRTAVLPGFRIRQRKQLLIITVFICQSITWQRRLPRRSVVRISVLLSRSVRCLCGSRCFRPWFVCEGDSWRK